MITYSTIDGLLKNKNAQRWMIAVFITAVALSPSALLWYMAEMSLAQTRTMITVSDRWMARAKAWESEADKWRMIAARASLQAAMCVPEASKCDAEKCVNARTGAPAMERRQ